MPFLFYLMKDAPEKAAREAALVQKANDLFGPCTF